MNHKKLDLSKIPDPLIRKVEHTTEVHTPTPEVEVKIPIKYKDTSRPLKLKVPDPLKNTIIGKQATIDKAMHTTGVIQHCNSLLKAGQYESAEYILKRSLTQEEINNRSLTNKGYLYNEQLKPANIPKAAIDPLTVPSDELWGYDNDDNVDDYSSDLDLTEFNSGKLDALISQQEFDRVLKSINNNLLQNNFEDLPKLEQMDDIKNDQESPPLRGLSSDPDYIYNEEKYPVSAKALKKLDEFKNNPAKENPLAIYRQLKKLGVDTSKIKKPTTIPELLTMLENAADNYRVQYGQGLKNKKGLKPAKHVKINKRGQMRSEIRSNVPLGIFSIDENQLNKGIVSLQYLKTNRGITGWPKIHVSSALKRVLLDIIHHHNVDISPLSDKEKSYVINLMNRSKSNINIDIPQQITMSGSGVKKAVKTGTIDDHLSPVDALQNQFNILTGEYSSYGGPVHNDALIDQLHKCFNQMKKHGVISAAQVTELKKIYK